MPRDAITLRQLEAFVALVDARHFRRAASRLEISQPTLTSRINGLERVLGRRLFERSHTGTLPTAFGRDLVTDARRVLDAHRTLVDRAKAGTDAPAGTYRLGVTPTVGPYLLPYILPDLHRRYATLKFVVREDAPRDLVHDLLAGRHDVALTPLPVEDSTRLTVTPLFEEPLLLVMAADHRLAKQARIRAEDLRGEPVLTLEEHHHFHRQVEDLCHHLGARLMRDYEGTSLDTLRHMVVMGLGVAFLPTLYVQSEIHQPEVLRVVQMEGRPIRRTYALVWRSTTAHPEMFAQLASDIRASVAQRLGTLVEPLESTEE